MPIQLLLADDNSEFLRGLRLMLEKYEDMQVIAEASSGTEAVRLALECRHISRDVGQPDIELTCSIQPDVVGTRTGSVYVVLQGARRIGRD